MGCIEGTDEGCSDGTILGLQLGWADDNDVGWLEGTPEGCLVGAVLGWNDGCEVGCVG